MKKSSLTKNKKLGLSKQTVRMLSTQELQVAAGGGTNNTCTCTGGCPTFGCTETNGGTQCCYTCDADGC